MCQKCLHKGLIIPTTVNKNNLALVTPTVAMKSMLMLHGYKCSALLNADQSQKFVSCIPLLFFITSRKYHNCYKSQCFFGSFNTRAPMIHFQLQCTLQPPWRFIKDCYLDWIKFIMHQRKKLKNSKMLLKLVEHIPR